MIIRNYVALISSLDDCDISQSELVSNARMGNENVHVFRFKALEGWESIFADSMFFNAGFTKQDTVSIVLLEEDFEENSIYPDIAR